MGECESVSWGERSCSYRMRLGVAVFVERNRRFGEVDMYVSAAPFRKFLLIWSVSEW